MDSPSPGVGVAQEAPLEGGEALLVERARLGDDHAYELLVRRYQALAVRTAYLITGDAAEAEDAAQDAFVKAHRHLARFRAGAPFRPWLLRIAANEARNRRIASHRRAGLAQRAAGPGGLVGGAGGQGQGIPPEEETLRREREAALRAAVNELRQEDRLVIAGRYFLDLTEAEMAEVLDLPRGTVKSRLSRALVRLRHHPLLATLLLALVALAGVLVTSPAARTALAERFGLRGVQIRHLPQAPALSSPIPGERPGAGTPPLPSSGGTAPPVRREASTLGVGDRVTLAEAQARVGFEPVAPAALGPPDEVYVSGTPVGGQVALVYRPRADLPAAGASDVGLLLTQFRGDLNVEPGVLGKGLAPGTTIQAASVGDGRGLWIAGQPHVFFFRDAGGQVRDETVRLAGNTLLWERGRLTLRLEAALPRDEAVAIAASVR